MKLADIHYLSRWTPTVDPLEFRIDEIHARLDRIETGIDELRSTNDSILRTLQGGAR